MCVEFFRSRRLSWLLAAVVPASSIRAAQEVLIEAAPGSIEVEDGRRVSGWLYNGSLPGPLLRAQEGEPIRVRLVNRLPEPTTIHWHGLPVPAAMDGVPGVTQAAVPPGGEFIYEFTASPSGTYFYHPHVGLQLDRGLYGVLIVDPPPGADPPSDRDVVFVLDDLLEGAPVSGRDPVYRDYLMNGRTSGGQEPIVVREGERIRIRFVNASGGTHYVVSVDGHPMTVMRADGRPVSPVEVQAIPIGAGERYDVWITMDHPGIWSIAAASIQRPDRTLVRGILAYEGQMGSPPDPEYAPAWLLGGTRLRYGALASAAPSAVLEPGDRTQDMVLGGGMMMSYVWTINGQAFPDADAIPVKLGETVTWRLINRTMAWHPMHLHGHFFKLLGTAGGETHAVLKDTVLLPPGMMMTLPASIQFIAENPGDWAFHCHQIYHMEGGMMRLLSYEQLAVSFIRGDASGDGKLDVTDAIIGLDHLFRGAGVPVCPDAADANDDGEIDITDPIRVLLTLFAGGSLPPPYPEPGIDSTADVLGCR